MTDHGMILMDLNKETITRMAFQYVQEDNDEFLSEILSKYGKTLNHDLGRLKLMATEKCLDYFKSRQIYMDAITNNNLDCLKFAHSHGCPLDNGVYQHAQRCVKEGADQTIIELLDFWECPHATRTASWDELSCLMQH